MDRARAATLAIDALLAHPEDIGETHFEETQGTAVIYVAKTPVLTLGPEDVEASGEASLSVLAAQVNTRLGDAISTERKRSAIAKTVFSFSLLVFSALIAFLLLGRASELAGRLRGSLADNPERVTAVRLGKIEFVSAGAARGALSIALTLGYRLLQVAIAYGWLIFGLSLFDATHGYTERLTGLVIKPLYSLAERVSGALPVAVVAGIAVFSVSVLVRFVGLFFDSVTRGETRITWLPRELARPTSALVRFGIIVVALVVASPLITGESDGALSRVGLVALFAVALACTPLAASAAVGVTVVFSQRFKKGDLVEVGGRAGRVVDVTLLDVRVEDDVLSVVSVPHLLGLFHPTRVHRHAPLSALDVVVDGMAPQNEVERVLLEAARQLSARGKVELLYLDGAGAHWRITSAASRDGVSLSRAVQDGLAKIGVGLGRAPIGRAAEAREGRSSDGAART
ncbi:Mechanosensitive ion channel family protein [Labilithrix luteola]|uniref:Mechanosensitive ion channel family protein n=1 Tax=Labilithrix luteola TaxID=1391654 RepID=A0A0K1QBN9_9BACT|nr:mechanosensitive ion channel domain-containing protein [Labilithrix luteola]AKV03148.1 Mechanosensitive ion channel family protein [Labilithrix luteola]